MMTSPQQLLEELATPIEIESLFQPIMIGCMQLTTRVVYAPLARCRARGSVPANMTAQYYSGSSLHVLQLHFWLSSGP
jgi:NADH:flavin oxidoreductase / NADH oxidase family